MYNFTKYLYCLEYKLSVTKLHSLTYSKSSSISLFDNTTTLPLGNLIFCPKGACDGDVGTFELQVVGGDASGGVIWAEVAGGGIYWGEGT